MALFVKFQRQLVPESPSCRHEGNNKENPNEQTPEPVKQSSLIQQHGIDGGFIVYYLGKRRLPPFHHNER